MNRLAQEFGLAPEWRAFELRPEGVPLPRMDEAYLQRVWAQSVLPLAAQRGLRMHPPSRRVRTRLALEGAEEAKRQGAFSAYHEAAFRVRYERDADLSDRGVLEGIAAKAGMDIEAFREVIEGRRHSATVERHRAQAAALGIEGIPAMLIAGRLVVGAHPYEPLREAVARVLAA